MSLFEPTQFLEPGQRLVPVFNAGDVVASSAGDSLTQWLDTLEDNRESLTQLVLEHGGLLLRQLPVASAEDFEAVAKRFLPTQASYIGGVSRRSRVHNNVYNLSLIHI